MRPVLDVRNVTKKYKNKTVVNKVSFNVVRGEIFGFVGPNGAGKSTTLKMICGLSAPTSGDIFINGKSVKYNFEKAIEHVGAFIDTPEMYPYLSGYDNLKILASLYGSDAVKRIPKLVELVGLKNRINDKFSKYSLGMKQRLALAQAMLNQPDLLILDEPTNGLDPNGIIEIRNILKNMAKKYDIAIIVSSHNLAELELLCDTITIIDKGKIIDYKSMTEIKKQVKTQQKVSLKVDYPHYTGRLLENKFMLEAQVIGNTVLFNLPEEKIASTVSFLVEKNVTIFGLEKIHKSLEELFLEILKKNNRNTSIF